MLRLSQAQLEIARLNELKSFHLDCSESKEFDQLTRLASRIFNVPISLVSLVDKDKQFFKSKVGLDVNETPRDVSFCAHAVNPEFSGSLYIPDAKQDCRFASNSLVTGSPFIRSYMGSPIVSSAGYKLGTLCVIDTKPRFDFGKSEIALLEDLAKLASDQLELWRLNHRETKSLVRWKNIAESSSDTILCVNQHGIVTFANKAASRKFGLDGARFKNLHLSALTDKEGLAIFDTKRKETFNNLPKNGETFLITACTLYGYQFKAEVTTRIWKDESSFTAGLIIKDVVEEKKYLAKLSKLASTDFLTGLSTRISWNEQFVDALARGQKVVVLRLDISEFKQINDDLGHAVGDEILKTVGENLQKSCPRAIAIARWGGDEFAVLLPDMLPEAIADIATKLISVIARPHQIRNFKALCSVCIGIACSRVHGSSPEELANAAETALLRAKQNGSGSFEIYKQSYGDEANAKKLLNKALSQAVLNDEFEVFYQPQVDIKTGKLLGAEALLRWRHPDKGLLTPAHFISELNDSALAPEVGRKILNEACLQAKKWQRHIPDFTIGINLFDCQLRDDNLPHIVEEVLSKTGLPPQNLELEIVETTIIKNNDSTIALLKVFRNMGVRIAFDDYGTGFAALNLLKSYPITRLKIDKSFLHNVDSDKGNSALVKAIIYLGKSFGISVIAEGVEESSQLDFLTLYGCNEAQGYYFGKPMDSASFEVFLKGKLTKSKNK